MCQLFPLNSFNILFFFETELNKLPNLSILGRKTKFYTTSFSLSFFIFPFVNENQRQQHTHLERAHVDSHNYIPYISHHPFSSRHHNHHHYHRVCPSECRCRAKSRCRTCRNCRWPPIRWAAKRCPCLVRRAGRRCGGKLKIPKNLKRIHCFIWSVRK